VLRCDWQDYAESDFGDYEDRPDLRSTLNGLG
jgi:hypothetical protein